VVELRLKGQLAMAVLACLNGETMPLEQARVPVWDRGFVFGDSAYEVLRIYGARCWLWDDHRARLERSLTELDFEPYDFERLTARIDHTISASGIRDGTVYVQITRGVVPRAHAFPDPPVPPTELIVVRPYDDEAAARLRESGAQIVSHPDLRWTRREINSTNLLPNVLAIEAARRAGCHEAVLIDSSGVVTEATCSSVLWVRDGRIEGTPEGQEIVSGMTRRLVLRQALSLDIPFAESRVTLPELLNCDEVILVGTTIEVLPVVSVDNHRIGSGRPGAIAETLGAAYRHTVQQWLARQPATDLTPGFRRSR
jgi:D-alanine transaminase